MAPPGRNQKITATRQDVAAGGPAANAAVTAAALGVRAVLVTALGQGPVAAAARADLEAHGVEILDTADADFPLAVSAVLVDEHTGERAVVSPDGALAVAPAPTRQALAALPRPDVVLLDGHHPAIARAVLRVVTTARSPRIDPPPTADESACPVLVLDAGRYRPIFDELLPHADVAALSDDFRIPGITTAATADAVLATGAAAVVITHGADPVEWHTDRPATGQPGTVVEPDREAGPHPRVTATRGTIDVPAVQAQDTLGAGDAFHGALTASLAHGCDLVTAVTRAVEVASTRVAVVGPRTWLARISGTSSQPSTSVAQTP